MGIYNLYDDFYTSHPTPEALGGKNRAQKAMRDAQGRFMPDNEVGRIIWQLDPEHGKAGALKRWQNYEKRKNELQTP